MGSPSPKYMSHSSCLSSIPGLPRLFRPLRLSHLFRNPGNKTPGQKKKKIDSPRAGQKQRKRKRKRRKGAYLQHLKLLDTLLHKLLYPSGIRLGCVLAEGVVGASLGILAEVVGGELFALSQEAAVLCFRVRKRVFQAREAFWSRSGPGKAISWCVWRRLGRWFAYQ